MLNLAAAQAEIEYRHQRLLQEAELERRSRAALPARAGSRRRARLAGLLAAMTPRHRAV
jgi:hypothetical protein